MVSEVGFEPRKPGCRAEALVATGLSYLTEHSEGSMGFLSEGKGGHRESDMQDPLRGGSGGRGRGAGSSLGREI